MRPRPLPSTHRTGLRPGRPPAAPWLRWIARALAASLWLLAAPQGALAQADEPAQAAPPIAQGQWPIWQGSREPQVLALSEGTQLAIGWIAGRSWPDQPLCSGTLVTGDTVITAAHCLPEMLSDPLVFGIGPLPDLPLALLDVRNIYRHPERDIALLRLSQDARTLMQSLRPIPINRTDLEGPMGVRVLRQAADVAGYGQTQEGAEPGRWFAKVRVVEILPNVVVVDGEGRQGLCFGDSGGPLILANGEGQPVLAAVEHRGDASCSGIDLMERLDVHTAWFDELLVRSGLPCDGLGFLGSCDGSVALWCEAGRVVSRDCAQSDQACGFVDGQMGYYCMPRVAQGADGLPIEPEVRHAPSARSAAGCAQSGARGPSAGWMVLFFWGLWGLRQRGRRRKMLA